MIYLLRFFQPICAPALYFAVGGGFLLYHLIVLVRIFLKRRKLKDYLRFVEFHYTRCGKETPALILRIQNIYIDEYNKTINSLIGKLLHLKKVVPGGVIERNNR